MSRASGPKALAELLRRAPGGQGAALLVRPARGARAVAGQAPGAQALARLAWRERGPRARMALLAGLAVAVLLAVGAILGSIGHPAGTAAQPGPAAIPGSGTRAARWLAGPAGKLLSAVSADLGRLTVAGRGTDPGQARLAGLRLWADARAALLGPAPPLAARLYRAALTELERAGRSAAQGRMRAATASLRAGESTITKVTAVANSPATPGAPAPEPAG
jgi:hypothetical protein